MIRAIRVPEGLPGGALAMLVTDGEDTLLIADGREWGCSEDFYGLLNSLLDEFDTGGGDFAVEEPFERRLEQARAALHLAS